MVKKLVLLVVGIMMAALFAGCGNDAPKEQASKKIQVVTSFNAMAEFTKAIGGDYISIVGDNGSGKSTLLRLILGFLKPVKGSIKRDTNNIRYVSQKNDFSHAGFPITVKEILDSYRKLLKIKNKHEVDRVLELTNMTEFKDRLISKLSGGQAQRVSIARALIGNPDLIILDEPSTGVDRKSQEGIYLSLIHI